MFLLFAIINIFHTFAAEGKNRLTRQVLLLKQQINFQLTEEATVAFRTHRGYRRKCHCQTSGVWSANLTRGEWKIPTVRGFLGSLSLESRLFPRGCLVSSFSGSFQSRVRCLGFSFRISLNFSCGYIWVFNVSFRSIDS